MRGNLGDMLFGIEMEVPYRCVESEARQWSVVITPSLRSVP